MLIIRQPIAEPPEGLSICYISVDRRTLAKRRWRGKADDGTEFGFDLTAPLTDGCSFHASGQTVYVVRQGPEPVLEIQLIPRPAPVARLGWALGNLHFPIQVTDEVIRVPDDPAIRQLLDRERIPYTQCERVFIPFAKAHAHEY